MNIIKVDDKTKGAQVAFNIIKDQLNLGAKTFGLATGSTPIDLYEKIVNSELDFSNSISINLDEYVNLSIEHEQSYHYFMKQHLFSKKTFLKSFLPNGMDKDLTNAIKQYNQIIEDYPVDIQLLGLGNNGHIGFNEPGTSFSSKTHIVELASSTIEANERFFNSIDEVPKKAITMGISQIMQAKKIIIMAYGENKAWAVARMLNGDVNENLPASILQKHFDVTLIVDEQAAKLI